MKTFIKIISLTTLIASSAFALPAVKHRENTLSKAAVELSKGWEPAHRSITYGGQKMFCEQRYQGQPVSVTISSLKGKGAAAIKTYGVSDFCYEVPRAIYLANKKNIKSESMKQTGALFLYAIVGFIQKMERYPDAIKKTKNATVIDFRKTGDYEGKSFLSGLTSGSVSETDEFIKTIVLQDLTKERIAALNTFKYMSQTMNKRDPIIWGYFKQLKNAAFDNGQNVLIITDNSGTYNLFNYVLNAIEEGK